MNLGQGAREIENPENQFFPELANLAASSTTKAFTMLKACEKRAYEAQKNLQMMYSTQEKAFYENKESQRKSSLLLEVMQFAKQQKERKKLNICMRSAQRKQKHDLNQKRREQHQDLMRSYQENLFQRNKDIFNEAKIRKKSYEKTIYNNRMKDMERKRRKKEELHEAKRQGQQFVDNYCQNKKLISILKREKEVQNISQRMQESAAKVNQYNQKASQAAERLHEFLEDSNVSSKKYQRIIDQARRRYRPGNLAQ